MVIAQIFFALAAHERERLGLEPPAGEQDRPRFHVRQLHHELDGGGDDREVFLIAQLFRAEQSRRAVVDHKMITVVYHLADKVRNLVLEFDVRLTADGVGEVGFGAVAEDGTAVGLCGVALLFELVKIAADGFLSDLIVRGKLADKNALVSAQLLQNFIFPFDC